MRGLSARGVENAALIARVGTGEEVSTQVSADYLRVSIGLGAKPRVVEQLPLARRDAHTVAMRVSPTAIDIVVDGSVRVTVPPPEAPARTAASD